MVDLVYFMICSKKQTQKAGDINGNEIGRFLYFFYYHTCNICNIRIAHRKFRF